MNAALKRLMKICGGNTFCWVPKDERSDLIQTLHAQPGLQLFQRNSGWVVPANIKAAKRSRRLAPMLGVGMHTEATKCKGVSINNASNIHFLQTLEFFNLKQRLKTGGIDKWPK